MSGLKIPLLVMSEGACAVDETVAEAALRPSHESELGVGSVRVAGTLSRVSSRYLFHGRMTGAYERGCDRCLAAAAMPFDLDVYWVYEHGTPREILDEFFDEDEEDEEEDDVTNTTYFDGDEIDLAPRAWEELVLAAPVKSLCKEDCAGLCPVCGADLNVATCGCPRAEDDSKLENKGFSGLADMFPDLKPDSSKE